jgi:glycosyltransferase involved in cell wall biosynthesis
MKQKITVLIPAYNAEKVLGECLESLTRQTLPPEEILVIDNNSGDGTKDLIVQFQKKLPTLRYVFEPRRGRANARNAGIAAATGEIIAMTDADCVLPPTWLASLTAPLTQDGENATIGFETDGAPLPNYWTHNTQAADAEFFFSRAHGKYIEHIDTKNLAIRAELAKKNFFNGSLTACEDWELFLRLKDKIKIRFLPEVTVAHQHPSSWRAVYKAQAERAAAIFKIEKMYPGLVPTKQRPLIARFKKAIKDALQNPSRLPYALVASVAWNIARASMRLSSS